MCKTRLKPRWITILTGVAICALVCVYSTSDSWAAMCMVGYNSSACSGKSSVPVPPTSTGDENGNSNPEIATDCERLGYAERGAKPNSSLWPKIALKNGANNKDKWVCDPCKSGGTLVRDKSGYARYNCYLRCQSEDEATNILGENGSIDDWKDNQTEGFGTINNRPIYYKDVENAVHRVYRDQFVRTQAECTTLFKSKEINGKWVPNKKFYWVTRNVCGQCIEQPCDGAEIIPGCYETCQNKYTLENGTQCCNKLNKLVSMNSDEEHPDWYLRTSPLYNESSCYITTSQRTAYGDFNNLPDSDPDAFCYHQVKMECKDADGNIDNCKEPKENGAGCECGPKSCETLASEDWAKAKGLTFSASTGNIVENSVMYHFDNGDVEKINDICYQKTLASDCPSSGCYTLSKLQCPNGKPNDDCSCGVGCPYGSIPESEYIRNSNYINGKVKTDAEGNPIDYCIELSSDGATCATWSKCYTYNECSDLGDFLVPDGSGSCKCGNDWKAEEEKDTCDFGISESTPKKTNPRFNKHDTTTPVGADTIVCYMFDGVKCPGILYGPDESNKCECYCGGDWGSKIDVDNYSSYCVIDGSETEQTESWTDTTNTPRNTTCYQYDYVECPYGTHLVTSNCSSTDSDDIKNQCECDSGTQINGSGEKPENADGKVYSYSVDHQTWTSTDGSSQTISCYDEGTKDCGDKLLVGNDCVDCDYLTAHDSDFEGSWTEGAPNSCDCGHTEWSKTYTSNGKSKTCTKCENNTTDQTCEEAGKIPANATPPYPNGDNDWWCVLDLSTECDAWENGTRIPCQQGRTAQSSYGKACANNNPPIGYVEGICSGELTDTCYADCKKFTYCVAAPCPQVAEGNCDSDLVKPSGCKSESTGFCPYDGKLCYSYSSSSGKYRDCYTQADWETSEDLPYHYQFN